MKKLHLIFHCVLVILMVSCANKKAVTQLESNTLAVSAVQQTIIYKTIKDFNHNVPILMNASRTQIISYPHPNDLLIDGQPTLPTQLVDGYLLDNRGISANLAFTHFTYAAYAAFKNPPSLEELNAAIIEKHPLLELYICGPRSDYESLEDLNNLIRNGFPGCEKIQLRVLQISL